MARLHYMSLSGVGPWEAAIKEIGAQLRPYQDYLWTAIKAAERRKPVLGWREADSDERQVFQKRLQERCEEQNKRAARSKKRRQRVTAAVPQGHWVILEPPPWRPEEPEDTFDEFFDAREVHHDTECRRDSKIEKLGFDREGQALMLSVMPHEVEPSEDEEDTVPTESHPHGPLLWLRPNTHTLQTQCNALRYLEDHPAARHAPLVRLLAKRATWEQVSPAALSDEEYVFLAPPGQETELREGTDEQRRFVEIALATPEFALLEGPPGSGKTTAICELVAQVVRSGGRVLLVASTHVAVDNVLERLLAWQDDPINEKLFLPVRIGDEERVTSADIKNWTLQRLSRTWRAELLDFLDAPVKRSPEGNTARAMLRTSIQKPGGDDAGLVRMILESANVVCGTTIGILQHPAIKHSRRAGIPFEPFDMMILDEASKTTFSEFLVPAMHARRWVIVGDIKQLSPYVEEVDLAENLRGLMPSENATAAVHAFLADSRKGRALRRSLLATDQEGRLSELAMAEAASRDVHVLNLDEAAGRPADALKGAIPEFLYADLIVGSPDAIGRFEHRLPADLTGTGGTLPALPDWDAARQAFLSSPHATSRDREEELLDWADEVAWRLIRSYELRQNEDERNRYGAQLQQLQPVALGDEFFVWRKMKPRCGNAAVETASDALQREVETVRRVAMPSILELLQSGFERLPGWRDAVALTDGLPPGHLEQRLVSLSFQHRMHPHLSAFSREQFYTSEVDLSERDLGFLSMYGEEWRASQDFRLAPALLEPLETARRKKEQQSALLKDAATVLGDREWPYPRYAHRAMWIDVAPRKKGGRGNSNRDEADVAMRELNTFVKWAHAHPRRNGDGTTKPWEVAVLTFYRGQEAELRRRLQRECDQRGNTRNFRLPRSSGDVQITLCTVDRFQGHEADIVFLSFVKSGAVGFLNSPNRLNVALTRAKYQIVLIGHRTFFASEKCRSDLLRALAQSPHYRKEVAWEVKS